MEYAYAFPVVRGVQANKDYYIAMVPLGIIGALFRDDDEFLPPEHRAQRRLNESRIPIIASYIIGNRDNYVFSALAASIDGVFSFIPSGEMKDVGQLNIALDARFQINDGQHRKAAILDALEQDPSLREETIPIVFFEDNGLARSQQIFTDLNKHAVKTSNSISELYDSRDPIAVATREIVEKIPFFNEYTDKERDNLGKYSSSLFTLNTFYQANKRLVGRSKMNKAMETFMQRYWLTIVKYIEPWQELIHHEISKKNLRETYIITQGVVIQALGFVGAHFYKYQQDMDTQLENLRMINWHRSAPEWRFRTIGENGRVLTNGNSIILTAIEIKKILGAPLSKDERQREDDFNRER